VAKQIIAIDIDDTIADSTESLRRRVNELHDLSITSEDYRAPDDYLYYYERLWKKHGLDLTLEDLEGEMELSQGHIPLTAGAGVALTELSKRFKIILITARNASWEKATKEWLHTHFADTVVEVHFSESPRYSTGKKSKGELCRELGVSWLIDDNPGHCQSAVDEGVEAILFGEFGWHHNAPDHLTRCKDWPAVLDYFGGK